MALLRRKKGAGRSSGVGLAVLVRGEPAQWELSSWWFRELRSPRRIPWRPTHDRRILGTVRRRPRAAARRRRYRLGNARLCGLQESGRKRVRASARPRPRLGRAWGGYLASLRRRFGYQELVELLPLEDERLVVFAAGDVYVVDLRARTIERTHRLRYFGRGKGRGLMAFGLTRDQNGAIYFGEYSTELAARPICIWKSTDEG